MYQNLKDNITSEFKEIGTNHDMIKNVQLSFVILVTMFLEDGHQLEHMF